MILLTFAAGSNTKRQQNRAGSSTSVTCTDPCNSKLTWADPTKPAGISCWSASCAHRTRAGSNIFCRRFGLAPSDAASINKIAITSAFAVFSLIYRLRMSNIPYSSHETALCRSLLDRLRDIVRTSRTEQGLETNICQWLEDMAVFGGLSSSFAVAFKTVRTGHSDIAFLRVVLAAGMSVCIKHGHIPRIRFRLPHKEGSVDVTTQPDVTAMLNMLWELKQYIIIQSMSIAT
jgi:hypothetical protein